MVTLQWPADATSEQIADLIVKRFGVGWLRSLAILTRGVTPDPATPPPAGVTPEPVTPESPPKPTPKPKAERKPRPKLTPEERQADLAKRFAEASTAKEGKLFGGPMPTHCGMYVTGTERIEVRMVDYESYIGRFFSSGTSTYRRLNGGRVRKLVEAAKTKDSMDLMRRRLRELHPDKSGREQTPEEREEVTALAKALDEAREKRTRLER